MLVCVVLPFLTAQTQPPATTPHTAAQPVSPLPQASGSVTVTATPAAISPPPGAISAEQEIELHIKVDPSTPLGPVSASVGPDLPDGVTATASLVGGLLVDRDVGGRPTGDLRQRVRLSFAGLPRRLDGINLLLTVGLGSLSRTIDLTLGATGVAPAGASLAMDLPADVGWSGGVAVPIVLTARGAPAAGLTLSAGPFTSGATKRVAPLHFCLADEPAGPCVAAPTLGQETQRQFFLIADQANVDAGSYQGTVRLLSSNGLSASQSVTLEISTAKWTLYGLLALAAGVVLSFLLTIYWPYQRERDLALRPFTLLRSRLAAAKTLRSKISSPDLNKVSGAIRDKLATRSLVNNGLIGGRLPPVSGPAVDALPLKAYLDQETAAVVAVEKITAAMCGANAAQLPGLDVIAAPPLPFPPADVDSAISLALGGQAGNARLAALPSLATIAERVVVENGVFWLVSSLLAVALGYVVLIEAKPAFGGVEDLLASFLWGLGLSTTGSKLADLTTGSIRTALRPVPATT